jgi:SH3 domain protein
MHECAHSARWAVVLLFVAVAAHAEDRWITDEFEVMLRSGQSNQQRIILQLRSGAKVEALRVDDEAGYTKVRTASGEEGWVLTRYLRSTPTAKLQLPAAQEQLQRSLAERDNLKKQLNDVKKERVELQREVADLQASTRSLQDQVDRITKLSANTIQVDDQNIQLKQRIASSEQQIRALEVENDKLASRSDREWFLVGGAVLALGLLLGLILPRISWRKKSSWSDF